MRKSFVAWALLCLMGASSAYCAVVEDWSSIDPGKNTGTYMDSNGSKIDFAQAAGPSGAKAIQLTFTLAQGGYCGIWHNLAADMSQAGSIQFMAKSTVPGEVQMALKDAFNVQYVANFQIPSTDWTLVTIPFSSFLKDPYYTPDGAVLGHPMDLSKTSGVNLAPHMVGSAIVMVGPLETSGTASAASAAPVAAPAAAPPAKMSSASGGPVTIQDYSADDAKAGGTFQDGTGSSFTYSVKDNSKVPGKKFLLINYNLVQGGYCGMWYKAGNFDADLSGASAIYVTVYCKSPIVLGMALLDKNHNQYVADLPSTQGGKWETVSVPLSSFHLDPYYAPPDAVKGAPMDFSLVKTFNFQPKTVGKFTLAVDSVIAK